MSTKIRVSMKKSPKEPLKEGVLKWLKDKFSQKGAPKASPANLIRGLDKLAGEPGGGDVTGEIKSRIQNYKIMFLQAGQSEDDWEELMSSLPNREVWMKKDEPAGAAEPGPEQGAPQQQKGKKAGVKAADLRAKPVKGKILTTKSVVNRLKAAGVTDQKVVDQANRVIKKYIEKAVAGQVPVYEAVNLAVGGQSLLKQLMRIPGLRSVPDSVIKQILKDLEVQLTANDIEVIKSKKDLAASRQKPDEVGGEPESEAVPAEEEAGVAEKDQAKLSDEDVQKLKNAVATRTVPRPWWREEKELADKIYNAAGKAVEDSVSKLELQEAFDEKGKIIYDKLLKKWNIK
jgi:hypothetical protein